MGFSNTFCRIELHKRRRRWIVEPFLNDSIPDEDAATVLPSRGQIRAHAADPTSLIAQTEDFASFYDQFQLSEAVQPYFCFMDRHERCWALTVLPMGCRISCRIAQLAATILASIAVDKSPVKFDVYIDNVEFLGAVQHVTDVTRKFHETCTFAGAILNDADGLQEKYEFIGEAFDLQARTRCLAKHPREKIAAAIEVFARDRCPTPRRFAAFIGLLLFASEVLDLDVAAHYRVMWVFRKMASEIGLGRLTWASLLPPLHPVVADDLHTWLQECYMNKPTRAVDSRPPSLFVMTDASEAGYGAVIWGDKTQVIARQWSAQDRLYNVGSSVVAEPLAAWNALGTVVPHNYTGHVTLISDHGGLVCAINDGCGHSWWYNEVVRKFRLWAPQARLSARFVPGKYNLADGLSRGAKGWDNGVAG